ncbi:ClpP/crotonase-like domain-containing protein [Hyaloscypha finlandica]|nr:ClpP/crotonase-like domain-containing protein [Hyaloscypha finlandica]
MASARSPLYLTLERGPGNIYIITLSRKAENKLNGAFCQELIRAFHTIHRDLGSSSEGAVITRGSNEKFWCMGIDLEDPDPWTNSDGFYPLISTILDFPYPTIALLTGHTFGAGCLLALAHDYRITSAAKRYFSLPAIDLGLSFPGMGILPRLKLAPQVARKMVLEAHRWTPEEALKDGIVDLVVDEIEIVGKAREVAEKWMVKAKAGAYGVLRNELWSDAGKAFREISFVHNKIVGPSKAKI